MLDVQPRDGLMPGYDNSFDNESRYDLSQEELNLLETELVEKARAMTDQEFCVAWVTPTSRFANFIRTKEVKEFPEAAEVDDYYDNHQLYLALIDLRGEGKLVHAASIMDFDDHASDPMEATEYDERTGFYTIDSLIARGNFTKDEFVAYYQAQGADLGSSISVEVNFKIRKLVEPFLGLGTADLAYLSIFNALIDKGASRENTVVFASINEQQAKSLTRNGFRYAPLMDRTDFDTEEGELGKDSLPVAIDFSSAYDVLAPLQVKLAEIHV
ncbi:MAG: hypothetical protein JWS12_563 [Candidatus Saccharibacteria bacterium]|nr:hypothetical protein [Candidatus Saccharibacteria bacterium]